VTARTYAMIAGVKFLGARVLNIAVDAEKKQVNLRWSMAVVRIARVKRFILTELPEAEFIRMHFEK